VKKLFRRRAVISKGGEERERGRGRLSREEPDVFLSISQTFEATRGTGLPLFFKKTSTRGGRGTRAFSREEGNDFSKRALPALFPQEDSSMTSPRGDYRKGREFLPSL